VGVGLDAMCVRGWSSAMTVAWVAVVLRWCLYTMCQLSQPRRHLQVIPLKSLEDKRGGDSILPVRGVRSFIGGWCRSSPQTTHATYFTSPHVFHFTPIRLFLLISWCPSFAKPMTGSSCCVCGVPCAAWRVVTCTVFANPPPPPPPTACRYTPGNPFQLPEYEFQHAFSLNGGNVLGMNLADAVNYLWQHLELLLEVNQLSDPMPYAYNFVMTKTWMLVVPRSREDWQGVGLNAMAFCGIVLLPEEKVANFAAAPLALLKSVCRQPMPEWDA